MDRERAGRSAQAGRTLFAGGPVLCGHRGSGRGVVGGHAENTLASFTAAVGAGVRWVEVDARLTRDGVLVARHDATLPDGRPVAELTAREAAAAGLMAVADLFDALPPAVAVDVDVKSTLDDALRPPDATTAARVGDLVGAQGGRPTLVTSFDPAAVVLVRRRVPSVAVGLITWMGFPLPQAIAAAAHLGVDVLVAHVGSFGLRGGPPASDPADPAHAVGVAHDAGLEVAAWCPDADEAAVLADAGVDCLVVDDAPSRATAAATA